MNGKLFIFCAPSGSGKTTIVKQLLDKKTNIGFSISATTRSPREGEIDGKDYYFMSKQEFQRKVSNNEFAEWEEVYKDTFYGTPKSEITRLWEQGKHVVFDVDVVGGINLKKLYKDRAVGIFVKVPSLEELKKRLISRGTETEESLTKRIDKMRQELEFEKEFDYTVVNARLEDAVEDASRLIDSVGA